MKTILLFTLLLFSSILYAKPTLKNLTNKYTPMYENIIYSVSKELGIDTLNITIFICDNQFDSNNKGQYAIIHQINDSTYTINISDDLFKEDRIKVMLHELVHLSQIYHKELVIRNCFVWYKNNVYFNDTPYEKRRYEVDASEKENELFFKYIREIRKSK